MKYVVIYEKTPTGYSAYVPDLPGIGAAGASKKRSSSWCAKLLSSIRRSCVKTSFQFRSLLPRPIT